MVVVVELVDVVVEVVVVVVLALTIVVPNDEMAGTRKLLRVLYPDTVKCTPSSMNRLLETGVNAVFQSAMARFG